MPIDQARVGAHIAAQMEAIEQDYGEDCRIGDICTVVEVLGPHGSHVRVRPSDARPHVGIGLLRWAEVTLMSAGRAGCNKKYWPSNCHFPVAFAAGSLKLGLTPVRWCVPSLSSGAVR